jgi:hypothetical protein
MLDDNRPPIVTLFPLTAMLSVVVIAVKEFFCCAIDETKLPLEANTS